MATVTINDLGELLLIDRLLDDWKDTARRTDSGFVTGYALYDRVRAALKEMLSK